MIDNNDISLEKALDTTYQIVIGNLSIEMLLNNYPGVHLMYDPFQLNQNEFVDMLNTLVEHYIDTEEYLKCAKLRDIINNTDSHKKILSEIVLDELDEDEIVYESSLNQEEQDVLGSLITKLKSMDKDTFSNGFKDFIKNEPLTDITDSEMWSILTTSDKNIFNNSFANFYKWVSTLTKSIRDEYIDRLLDDKPLIPEQKESFEMKEERLTDDIDFIAEEETLDYENNIIISFLDEYTIMSHKSKAKLEEIRSSLIMHGILCVEMRQKGDVYSLVYHSSQKPRKPNWN